MQAQEIWIEDTRYLLLDKGAIVSENWQGEEGYAHLFNDGTIYRYGEQIARVSDIQFGNMVEIEITPEILTSVLFTIFGTKK